MVISSLLVVVMIHSSITPISALKVECQDSGNVSHCKLTYSSGAVYYLDCTQDKGNYHCKDVTPTTKTLTVIPPGLKNAMETAIQKSPESQAQNDTGGLTSDKDISKSPQ